MSWTAIVLAGSRPGRDPFAEQFGTDLKALIPVGGEPMVLRPVRALLESASVGDVIVMAQEQDRIAAVLRGDPRLSVRASQGTIAETILGLIDASGVDWPLLITTGDHALLDAATVDEFCRGAEGADIGIGVVERANLLRRLPSTKRTWLQFRGGAYTGANLFALTSAKARSGIELWRSVEQDRKKGWPLIRLAGPFVLAGVALRLLTIDAVVARLGRKLGLKMTAIRMSNPLAGVDVDKPADHALAEAIIAGKA